MTASSLQVSVVIPHFNRVSALEETLVALGTQEAPSPAFEVIIVDDGSSDWSPEVLTGLALPYELAIVRQANKGPGAARNAGVRRARADRFVFLDADMIPGPELVSEYLTGHVADPEAILIGRQRPWPGAYRSLFDRVTGFETYRDLGQRPFAPSFFHVSSGNLSIARPQFEVLGGFDEELRVTEDTDFGYRAQQMGIPIVYWPGATGYHNHPKNFSQRCHQVQESAMWTARLFHKHPPMSGLLPTYCDIERVSWRSDSAQLVARKMGRRFLVTRPVRGALEFGIRWAEHRAPNLGLLRSLYWKVLSGYRVQGYRDGLRKWGASM